MRQWHTNYADGVSGVTQCPLPPGQSQVYEFTATQYGTSWYHSHFSLQYTDGIAGPLVIHGPASANYDVDLGPLSITDWYHQDAFSLWYIEKAGTPAPRTPSKLMNGKYGTVNCVPDPSKCVPGEASPFTQVFEKGKRYLWRIINMSAVAHYTFWIDGHNFTVISTDFVPITPFETHNITVAIGQRYDIIVEANADLTHGTDFWINMYNCDLKIDQDQPFTGIIRYDNKSSAIPSTTAPKVPTPDGCHDSPSSLFTPVVPRTVPRPSKSAVDALQFDVVHYETSSTSDVFVWDMANTTLQIDWSNPSLSYAGVGSQPKPFPALYAPIPVNGKPSSWKYFVIQGDPSLTGLPTHPNEGTFPNVAHVSCLVTRAYISSCSAFIYFVLERHTNDQQPIHLHGHDFVILRQQPGRLDLSTFDPSTLPTDNPARRDVAMLDGGGHLILAFQIDNPGVWLLHCHIAWHVSGGLGFQFVERESEIPGLVPNGVERSYEDQCRKWTAYYKTSPQKQDDSGV